MNSYPKNLLAASAVILGTIGLVTLFLPAEFIQVAGMGAASVLSVQLSSSGFLALAFLNWNGRGAIYGGIYGRPIILANMMFGVITSTTMAAGILDLELNLWLWVLVGLLGGYVLGFGYLMWSPPGSK